MPASPHIPPRTLLPQGRYVELPGRGRTFVRELAGPAGAPVVVLLHGWMTTADLNWFPAFGPLGRHFRVLALDHRGHGRGMRPAGPFSLEHCADDVAALATTLDIAAFTAVGYSMGGAIAQLLQRRHPEMVTSLVLCATAAHFTGSWRERTLFRLLQRTAALSRTGVLQAGARTARSLCSTLAGHNAGLWSVGEVLSHDWERVVEAGLAILQFDSRAWLAGIRVPTAVVATALDTIVPPARQVALARGISDATVHPVPGGHGACTETPEVFVPELVRACLTVAGAPARPLLAAA